MVTTTIPVSGFEDVDGSGNVLLSDRERASRFFELLATDQQLPPTSSAADDASRRTRSTQYRVSS